MSDIAIILVRPQLGENIGAAARVMKNFGLTDLRIVAPRDRWPNPAAEAMAAGGVDVLGAATITDSLEQAVADLQQLYATTARRRDMTKPELSSYDLGNALEPNCKTGMVFGPERSGLTNEDITLCDAIIYIPVAAEYGSLNLAQAVAITCYEVSKVGLVGAGWESKAPDMATKGEVQGMLAQLEQALEGKGYYENIVAKKPKMRENLNNIFTRSDITSQEVQTLRGVIKALSKRVE